MNILVFSELDSVAFELLSHARDLGDVSAAIIGSPTAAKASPADYYSYGAKICFVGEDPRLTDFRVDVYADALLQITEASGAQVVLIGSTKRGKELAGRLAQKLDCGAITDATSLVTQDNRMVATRYALGGNTLATEAIISERAIVAILPRTFEGVPSPVPGKTVKVELKLRDPRTKVVERKPKASAVTDIESAESLVVVGKGFGKKQDLALAEALARALGGELGCTRSLAADLHWLGEERMVGISGKKCKPRLMISVGVSGQIQHAVAILGSKIIVAVNKDKSAPIFKLADYGIVGDLYLLLPKLTEKFHT